MQGQDLLEAAYLVSRLNCGVWRFFEGGKKGEKVDSSSKKKGGILQTFPLQAASRTFGVHLFTKL